MCRAGAALNGGAVAVDREIKPGHIVDDHGQPIGAISGIIDRGKRVGAVRGEVDRVRLTICVRSVDRALQCGDVAIGDIKTAACAPWWRQNESLKQRIGLSRFCS